jgi:beta-glucosidase
MPDQIKTPGTYEERAKALLEEMTLAEKVGQMCQLNASEGYAPDYLRNDLQSGRLGSVLNVVDVEVVNELQRISVEE